MTAEEEEGFVGSFLKAACWEGSGALERFEGGGGVGERRLGGGDFGRRCSVW